MERHFDKNPVTTFLIEHISQVVAAGAAVISCKRMVTIVAAPDAGHV